MSEEFNWLDYAEPEESAPEPPPSRGLRRFRPRLPGRLRLPSLPSLPKLPRLPVLRRRGETLPAPTSAADLLGDRADKPIEDLDERLQLLRERSVESSQPAANARPPLYDVDDVLATPEVLRKPGGVISAVALSKAQERQVELLKDIVGGAQADEARDRRVMPGGDCFFAGRGAADHRCRHAPPGRVFAICVVGILSGRFAAGRFPRGSGWARRHLRRAE